nr:uncharacterized protein LOC128703329 [Cherax quadricarinatus]
MAPNIAMKDIWEASADSSLDTLEVPEPVVADVPEVFLSHLPQHFQNPDSPNLYIQQQHESLRTTQQETTKTQGTSIRSTLRAYRPTSETTTPEVSREPSSSTLFEDIARVTSANVANKDRRLRPQDNVTPKPEEAAVSSVPQDSNNKKPPGTETPESSEPVSNQTFTKEPVFRTAKDESGRVTQGLAQSRPSTSTQRIDPGVLKLPGHEPEAPADLVLVHHERAIDTRNQTGLNGIFVRDDTTAITPEGATALILVGICTVFLVFICLIFFIQKVRRQRLENKVVQDSDVKPQTMYDATGYTSHHPNPLSLLPPALLHALASLTLSTHGRPDDHIPPSFLTMEPPLSSNSLGRLWFSVHYDYVESTLVIRILHARYTKGRGSSTKPGDVWVEVCVLTPMNGVRGSTNTGTRRASSAPVFNQTFRFKVGDEEVTQFLLRLTMYDRHPQTGEKAVGSVIVPLSTVDLCSNETISRELQ